MENMEMNSACDNTKVVKIMGDFQEFLTAQNRLADSKPVNNIPFGLNCVDNLEMKTHDSEVSDVMLKIKVTQIEADYASMEKSYMKSKNELESQCEKLTTQNLHLQDKLDKLQQKLKQQTLQALALHDELQDVRGNKESQIQNLENNFMQMQKLKQETDQRLSEEVVQLTKLNKDFSTHNLDLQTKNNFLRVELQEAYAVVDQHKAKLTEVLPIVNQYEEAQSMLRKAEQEMRELNQRLTKAEDAETLAKTLREDINRWREMEREYQQMVEQNQKLKENQENSVLLKEQLLSAESKLTRAEEKFADFAKLEVERNILMSKLEELEATCVKKELLQPLQCQVDSLRRQLEICEEKRMSAEKSLVVAEKRNFEDRAEIAKLENTISELTADAASRSAQLIRLRKRTALLAKERDSIREILQSYDAELTMTSHASQLYKRLKAEEESNKRLHSRIEELEEESKITKEEAMHHKLRAKQLESSRGAFEQEPGTMPSAIPAKEVLDMKEKIHELEKERAGLIDRKEELEAWIENRRMSGDYNPDTTKVVHFSLNPAAMAHQKSKQDVADLKEENAKLRQKLERIQEGHDVSLIEGESLKTAKEQLAMANLRNQRLKEVFSKKIQEFRQACYSLTGYRIDSSTDSKYTLVSMYGESETDYLLFEMQPNGEMQLLETEYSKTLEELINLHLHHQNSIPVFLSALCMNLFSQQTIMEI